MALCCARIFVAFPTSEGLPPPARPAPSAAGVRDARRTAPRRCCSRASPTSERQGANLLARLRYCRRVLAAAASWAAPEPPIPLPRVPNRRLNVHAGGGHGVRMPALQREQQRASSRGHHPGARRTLRAEGGCGGPGSAQPPGAQALGLRRGSASPRAFPVPHVFPTRPFTRSPSPVVAGGEVRLGHRGGAGARAGDPPGHAAGLPVHGGGRAAKDGRRASRPAGVCVRARGGAGLATRWCFARLGLGSMPPRSLAPRCTPSPRCTPCSLVAGLTRDRP